MSQYVPSKPNSELKLGRVPTSQPWQVRAVQLLSVGGLLVAYFLKLYHDEILFVQCGDGSQTILGHPIDCGLVSGPTSRWSYLNLGGFSMPIAELGLYAYATIFGSIWLSDLVTALRPYVKHILLLMTGGGLLFTGYLTYLEMFVIEAWCLYCLYSAGIILAMFLLMATAYLGRDRPKL